jgi:uncharacterized protein
MIRVVLDTNIVVSALLQPAGPPAQVFVLAISGAVQLCVSGSIYAEYEEVISRPKFGRDAETVARTLQTIRESAHWVRPGESIRICSDATDDVFLECAAGAQAQYLVTGNLRHFPDAWAGVRVVSARSLLDILSDRV